MWGGSTGYRKRGERRPWSIEKRKVHLTLTPGGGDMARKKKDLQRNTASLERKVESENREETPPNGETGPCRLVVSKKKQEMRLKLLRVFEQKLFTGKRTNGIGGNRKPVANSLPTSIEGRKTLVRYPRRVSKRQFVRNEDGEGG